jgi:hypothetical protein
VVQRAGPAQRHGGGERVGIDGLERRGQFGVGPQPPARALQQARRERRRHAAPGCLALERRGQRTVEHVLTF